MLDPTVAAELKGIAIPAIPTKPILFELLLILLGLLALIGLGYIVYRRQQQLRWPRALKAARGQKNAAAQLHALAEVFRRFALSKSPRQTVSALHSDAWVRFLEQRFSHALPVELRALLSQGVYRDSAYLSNLSVEELFEQARLWLAKVQRR